MHRKYFSRRFKIVLLSFLFLAFVPQVSVFAAENEAKIEGTPKSKYSRHALYIVASKTIPRSILPLFDLKNKTQNIKVLEEKVKEAWSYLRDYLVKNEIEYYIGVVGIDDDSDRTVSERQTEHNGSANDSFMTAYRRLYAAVDDITKNGGKFSIQGVFKNVKADDLLYLEVIMLKERAEDRDLRMLNLNSNSGHRSKYLEMHGNMSTSSDSESGEDEMVGKVLHSTPLSKKAQRTIYLISESGVDREFFPKINLLNRKVKNVQLDKYADELVKKLVEFINDDPQEFYIGIVGEGVAGERTQSKRQYEHSAKAKTPKSYGFSSLYSMLYELARYDEPATMQTLFEDVVEDNQKYLETAIYSRVINSNDLRKYCRNSACGKRPGVAKKLDFGRVKKQRLK